MFIRSHLLDFALSIIWSKIYRAVIFNLGVYVRITKRLVIVGMEILVSLCMIEGITSLDGKWRRSGMK